MSQNIALIFPILTLSVFSPIMKLDITRFRQTHAGINYLSIKCFSGLTLSIENLQMRSMLVGYWEKKEILEILTINTHLF